MSQEDHEGQDEFRKGLSFAARVGMELVVATMVGAFLGYLLDRFLGTKPWLMVAGVVVGAIAGFLNVYRFVQRMSKS
ncbi:MAG: AtpZ/AtpI family protein [Nitrospira sp.]|nr:AtpZ/AtpI family protein [Nitrospira sp.]